MSILDTALMLAAQHIPVFFCNEHKAPTMSGGFKNATTDAAVIRRMWHRCGGSLIAMPCGEISDRFVVDVDSAKHPEAAEWLERHAAYLGDTYQCTTRSGGTHIFYRHHPEQRTTAGRLCKGIDTRGPNSYVVLWAQEVPGPVQEAPDWLLRALQPPKPEPQPIRIIPRARCGTSVDDRVYGLLKCVGAAREGERNAVTYWAARRLVDMITAGELDQCDALDALDALYDTSRAVGLPEREVDTTIKSALARPL